MGLFIVNRGEWLGSAARLFEVCYCSPFWVVTWQEPCTASTWRRSSSVDKRSVLTRKLLILVYSTTKTTKTYSWTCLEITVSCLAALLAVEPRGSGYRSFLPHETRHIANSAKIGSMSRTKYRVADNYLSDFQRQIENGKAFTLLDTLIF